jgi:thymidylate synthase
MNNRIDYEYIDLINDIFVNGREKGDRTGTGTKSVFGREIRHNMADGFPLLTTKKMPFRILVTELIWFLKGDTNIRYLVDNGCNIWNGDAYKGWVRGIKDTYTEKSELREIDCFLKGDGKAPSFLLTQKEFLNKIKTDNDFAKKYGELGPIYGGQWRKWGDENIDQIKDLIHNLKTNPDSRRLMVNAWNVSDIGDMTLPPCHYGFQAYTRELSDKERIGYLGNNLADINLAPVEDLIRFCDENNVPTRAISLKWNQRSVDTFLGLPFNIASYALLLLLLSKEVNMVPEELIGSLGDVHLYSNHITQANELVTRIPFDLPSVTINDSFDIDNLGFGDFTLNGYESHSTIKAPLSN